MKENTKPKYNMWQNVCFMVRYAWRYRKSALFLGWISVLALVGIRMTQLYVAPVILDAIEHAAPVPELLTVIGLFTVVLFLLTGTDRFTTNCFYTIHADIAIHISNDLNQKACTTSYPNSIDPTAIRLLEKARRTTENHGDSARRIWRSMNSLAVNLICFVMYLFFLARLHWIIPVAILAASIAEFFFNLYLNRWTYRHRDEEATAQKQMGYIIERSEAINLAKDIRIFGLQPWLEAIYRRARLLMEHFLISKEKVDIWSDILDVLLTLARNGIAYLILIRMTLEQGLPASEFLFYLSAVGGFADGVAGILRNFSLLHEDSLNLSSVQEYLNLPEPFCLDGGEPIPAADGWELQLDNVTFRYPGAEADLFRKFNLTIHPGEKLAIVGLNGAGKTTLVKLLCGLYDPTEGRVLLNGTDIRCFNRREYYRLFSAVFQEYSPLDISIAENVAQSVTDIDPTRVQKCLDQAGLAVMLAALPKGLETIVGKNLYPDGLQFSGGQTQRLMLARALYKGGGILVLDEPTAALDPIAEHDIYLKYHEMSAGKTAIFISHRLASTRFCDRIVFLADGTIAEEGTHEQLLHRGGAYAELFAVQSQYYQEGATFHGEEP